MSKSFLLVTGLATAMSLTACGHKGDSKDCKSGVNADSCSASIERNSSSVWTQSLVLGNSEKEENRKKLTISYRFKNTDGVLTWERMLTVTSKDSNRAMIEGGLVAKTTDDHLELIKSESSCDSGSDWKAEALTIYTARNGQNIELSKSPIKKEKETVLGVVGSALTNSYQRSIKDVLMSGFTWGSARSYLDSAEGTYTLTNSLSAEEASAELGCFSVTRAAGFIPSTRVKNIQQ